MKKSGGADGQKQREILGHFPVGVATFEEAAKYISQEVGQITDRDREANLKDGETVLRKVGLMERK